MCLCLFPDSVPESISMVDPVIDEHFRRSLGADYMNLFGKKQETTASRLIITSMSPEQRRSPHLNQTKPTTESSQPSTPLSYSSKEIPLSKNRNISRSTSPGSVDVVDGTDKSNTTIAMSVDDHFAKALGATWTQLQQAEKHIAASTSEQSDEDEDYSDDDMTADDNFSSSPNPTKKR